MGGRRRVIHYAWTDAATTTWQARTPTHGSMSSATVSLPSRSRSCARERRQKG